MHIKSNKILKLVFIFCLFFTTIAITVRYSFRCPPSLTKKELWQKMEQEVATWGDALGKGIDVRIKDTVIVLNLLGFKTEQSCEGHIDWGRPYPWVRIASRDSEINNLRKKALNIFTSIEQKESEIQKKYPNLSPRDALRKDEGDNTKDSQELLVLYQAKHQLNDEIEKLSTTKMIPLRNLIFDFYKNRTIDLDSMIIISEFDNSFELYSIGGNWQTARDKEEKKKKLIEYQQEMKSFADFLTDYYFEKK